MARAKKKVIRKDGKYTHIWLPDILSAKIEDEVELRNQDGFHTWKRDGVICEILDSYFQLKALKEREAPPQPVPVPKKRA